MFNLEDLAFLVYKILNNVMLQLHFNVLLDMLLMEEYVNNVLVLHPHVYQVVLLLYHKLLFQLETHVLLAQQELLVVQVELLQLHVNLDFT